MRQYDERSLIVHPQVTDDPGVIVSVDREKAGWQTIDFQVRSLAKGKQWKSASTGKETALVVLSGTISVNSDQGNWKSIGERSSVFSGLPYALYLPLESQYEILADTDSEFAIATVPASKKFPAHLITPADVHVEVRGGDHATRQINDIIPPGFPCEHLVVVEVYTPAETGPVTLRINMTIAKSPRTAACWKQTWMKSIITKLTGRKVTLCSVFTPVRIHLWRWRVRGLMPRWYCTMMILPWCRKGIIPFPARPDTLLII